jgi:conjugal transfer pilus assembly protein TraU
MKVIPLLLAVVLLSLASNLWSKSGKSFDYSSDIHSEEIELTFLGICICPRPPPIFYEEGEIWTYWEPFAAVDTVSTPYYSPFMGSSIGGSALDELGGTNSTQDAVSVANEVTFSQAHIFPLPMMEWMLCSRRDYPVWISEYDAQWNNDGLSILIHPEASLFANKAMQLLCMTDAIATNLGYTLDYMPWCIGSGGSSYPMTGSIQNDEITQANNSAAARLIYKMNRIFMICDPYESLCGCQYTPVWIKSHYKTHVVRPGDRSPAWPFGATSTYYNSGLNVPMAGGGLGPNDEYLWTVYRRQLCCTCCD